MTTVETGRLEFEKKSPTSDKEGLHVKICDNYWSDMFGVGHIKIVIGGDEEKKQEKIKF